MRNRYIAAQNLSVGVIEFIVDSRGYFVVVADNGDVGKILFVVHRFHNVFVTEDGNVFNGSRVAGVLILLAALNSIGVAYHGNAFKFLRGQFEETIGVAHNVILFSTLDHGAVAENPGFRNPVVERVLSTYCI